MLSEVICGNPKFTNEDRESYVFAKTDIKALLILKPENPLYKDEIYRGEELSQIHVLGKAVAFQSNII